MNISQILQVAQEIQHARFSLSNFQDPIQSQFGTQLNYRLSGELELDAQGQFPSIGVELLGQGFGAKLNESYPQGTATLTLGLHTSLLRGRDYLIYK
ncbi:hypothetical protein DPMN_151570, partial [Dreissena polymorpha]